MQRNKFAFTICLGLAVMLISSAALAQYQLTNLDSNQVGAAKHTDPLMVPSKVANRKNAFHPCT